MGKYDTILQATFSISGNPYTVILQQHQITWCPKTKGGEDLSEWMIVKLKEVLSVDIKCYEDDASNYSCCFSSTTASSSSNSSSNTSLNKLVVNYAQKKENSKAWTNKSLILEHPDSELVDNWVSTIQTFLNGFKHRPKKFLVFVNPFGGKQKANSIYDRRVRPILELSKVNWTVIHTQKQNHVTEYILSLSEEKLLEYDLVVAVGGDGTVCELVTGLLMREFSSDKKLTPAVLPIGVVPAGSSNALAFSLHGTGDPKTAAIFLIIGSTTPLDVGAIHNFAGLARFIVTQMSYGHLADTMQKSEKLRWMGPKRYDYAGLCKFLGHSTYDGSLDIRICPSDSRKAIANCEGGTSCDFCNSYETSEDSTESPHEWKRIEGTFLGISGANISCKCALSPNGIAPFAHISDGCLELILIRKTSHVNHLKYLLKCAGNSESTFSLPFVERYRVREFVFTPVQCCDRGSNGNEPLPLEIGSANSVSLCGCDTRILKKNHSLWNCDGELLFQPSVRVVVHSDLIRIMAH